MTNQYVPQAADKLQNTPGPVMVAEGTLARRATDEKANK